MKEDKYSFYLPDTDHYISNDDNGMCCGFIGNPVEVGFTRL